MPTKVQIVFYSMFGHVHRLAEAVADGAREVPETAVELLQVAELADAESLKRSGADQARAAFAHVPIATQDHLADADAIIFGTPTRFGNMAAPMRNFLDRTGKQWAENAWSARWAASSPAPRRSTAGRRRPSRRSTPPCCTRAWSSSACPTRARS